MEFLVQPMYSGSAANCPNLQHCNCYHSGDCNFHVCVDKGSSCIAHKVRLYCLDVVINIY